MAMIIQYLLHLLQKKNPEIAIAVYVENGGWGSTWAAPLRSIND